MVNGTISDNIKRLRGAIGEAAAKTGRGHGEITLVAASKTHGSEKIRQAIAAGVDAVGENRVQELALKNSEGAYQGAPLHFIGTLQSNKAGKIVGVCDLIESVGSKALIDVIGRKAASLGIVQDILLEINIGREEQKSGILPEQADEVLHYASQNGAVNVLGLMAIPPIFDKNERICNFFAAMHKLYIDMGAKKYDNVSMRFLSMGMSDSFEEAILSGSNMVRIGSAIFGAR